MVIFICLFIHSFIYMTGWRSVYRAIVLMNQQPFPKEQFRGKLPHDWLLSTKASPNAMKMCSFNCQEKNIRIIYYYIIYIYHMIYHIISTYPSRLNRKFMYSNPQKKQNSVSKVLQITYLLHMSRFLTFLPGVAPPPSQRQPAGCDQWLKIGRSLKLAQKCHGLLENPMKIYDLVVPP